MHVPYLVGKRKKMNAEQKIQLKIFNNLKKDF